MANPQMYVEVVTSGAQSSVTVVGHGDDVGDAFGDDEDFVIVLNADAYSANAVVTDVLVGTPVTPGLAANSAILSNTTASGDILFAVADGSTNSQGLLMLDGSESNVHISNESGMVIGHTAQLATNVTPEFQVLGSDTFTDNTILIAGFSTNPGAGPLLQFLKSGNASVGNNYTIVTDGELLGSIQWFGADGNDFSTRVASLSVKVDDTAGPAQDAIDAEMQFYLGATVGTFAEQEVMRINANGMMTYGGGVARDTGIIFDNAGTDYHIGLDQTADDFIIGTTNVLAATDTQRLTMNTTETKFNEDGLDLDFIVESDNVPNMLFVSGESNAVGVGAEPAPSSAFSISGTQTNMAVDRISATAVGNQLSMGGSTLKTGNSSSTLAIGVSNANFPAFAWQNETDSLTLTNSTNVYIAGPPTAADSSVVIATGSNYALWVDAGVTRLDGFVGVGGATTPYAPLDIKGSSTNYLGGLAMHSYAGNAAFSVHMGGSGEAPHVFLAYADNASGGDAAGDFTGRYSFHNTGEMHIGTTNFGTDNTFMTEGLTINMGGANDEILALKSSDVTHTMTAVAEEDTFGFFAKARDDAGGLKIVGVRSDVGPNYEALLLQGKLDETAANTAKTASGWGVINLDAEMADGTGGQAVGADGNLVSIATAGTVRFIVDTEGQIYATANGHTGDISVGAIADHYDDAQLVRAFDHAKTSAGAKGMIKDKWDNFVEYNEQDLIAAGVLGDTMENGGLLNVTGLQRLHNGAIWQGYVKQQEMQEKIDTLENRLLAIEGAK